MKTAFVFSCNEIKITKKQKKKYIKTEESAKENILKYNVYCIPKSYTTSQYIKEKTTRKLLQK